MKNIVHYAGWIAAIVFCVLYFVKSSAKVESDQKADTLRATLTKTLPSIIAQSKTLKDSSKKRDTRDSLAYDKRTLQADTGSNVLTKIDTVNIYLRKLVATNKKDYQADIQKKKDSIDYLQNQNKQLFASNNTLRKGLQNIIFKGYSKTSPLLPDTMNAAIYAKPFKKSTNQNLFSPQRNFLRIYNQRPGGTVNDMPYFDYEQTNDEINQLLFQARAADNLSSGIFQLGLGVELKLNKSAFSVAAFGNPFTQRNPTVSLGFRHDLYRIIFK